MISDGSRNFNKWGQGYIIKIYIKLYKRISVQKLYKVIFIITLKC